MLNKKKNCPSFTCIYTVIKDSHQERIRWILYLKTENFRKRLFKIAQNLSVELSMLLGCSATILTFPF